MRRIVFGALAVGLFLTVAVQPTFAASTSPGKNSVFVSGTGTPLPLSPTALLSGTIAKGKKKKVLAIEAMLTNGPYAPIPLAVVLNLFVVVNGFPVEPTTGGSQGAVTDCGAATPPVSACTLTGTWWLDLDAAELAHPGIFIGKPLLITLVGGDLNGGGIGAPFDVTLTVRLQAK